jgi:hypothetical protein
MKPEKVVDFSNLEILSLLFEKKFNEGTVPRRGTRKSHLSGLINEDTMLPETV